MTKAILFDFDGVLADSISQGLELQNILAKKFSIPKMRTIEEFRKSLEGDYRAYYATLGIDKKTILAMERFFHQSQKQFEGKVKLYPGVKKFLVWLSQFYKVGIVSNNHTSFIKATLKQEGCLSSIHYICGWKKGKIKPDPAQILQCMKNLSVEAEETSFVGDMDVDILAARNAHVAKVIAVTTGYHPKEKLVGADIYINSVLDLRLILP